jgi:surfeit locus 1 family protein
VSATPSTDPRGALVEPPSFWRTAVRPRWIGALLLALAVAAGFAALGQWQIGRAAETAVVQETDDGAVRPLADVDTPQTGVTGEEGGALVSISGRLVPGDTVLLPDRLRVGSADPLGGRHGWWVVGHLVDADGDSLAVALGWASTRDEAVAARDRITTAEGDWSGRYLPPESPDSDEVERGRPTAMSTATLINLWKDAGPAYSGYLVADRPASGLERIVAPPPEQESSLNLLNLFYAAEWALFAGFAVYLWVRLVKDAVEAETEAAAADPSGSASGRTPGDATVE